MRLNDNFIAYESDGKQILIDSAGAFAGLIRNNKTAAFIVQCLKQETTESEIVKKLQEKYDAQEDVIKKDVHSVIEKLRKTGAIKE